MGGKSMSDVYAIEETLTVGEIVTFDELLRVLSGCPDAEMRRVLDKVEKYRWHEGEPGPWWIAAGGLGYLGFEWQWPTNYFAAARVQAAIMHGIIFDPRSLGPNKRPKRSLSDTQRGSRRVAEIRKEMAAA